MNYIRLGKWGNFGSNFLYELGAEGVVEIVPVPESDEDVGALAFDGVRLRNDGRLSNGRMLDQRRLHLRGGHQMTRTVHHVVDSTSHPKIPLMWRVNRK